MRFAVMCEVPVDVGNAFEKDPRGIEKFAQYLEQLKPEAAYFGSSKRIMILIIKADSEEELTKQIFPIWHILKTYPQVEPVTTIEEFKAISTKMSEFVKGL